MKKKSLSCYILALILSFNLRLLRNSRDFDSTKNGRDWLSKNLVHFFYLNKDFSYKFKSIKIKMKYFKKWRPF